MVENISQRVGGTKRRAVDSVDDPVGDPVGNLVDNDPGVDVYNPMEQRSVTDYMSQMLERKRRKIGGDNESEEESASESENDSDSDDSDDLEPAMAGVIEKLVLKNFMCHDCFELDLGPQINFIIGRNGSGKSAILTGISIGLGAKASDTSRGSSIRNLIKDGKSTAKISLTFLNKGSEAYKPEVFGSRIVIERKIQRQGTNGYAIKAENLKTISNKKAILDEILYKFNIAVDNPLAFLSQDKAREFLTLTTDQAKYEYFMAGSLINDIIENYRLTSENIVEVQSKLKLAKTHLEVATKRFDDSAKIYNRFKKSDSLRKQLELIHGKIYWFNVRVIEKKIKKYRDQLEQSLYEIDVIDKKLDEISSKREGRKQTKIDIENNIGTLGQEIEKMQTDYDETKQNYLAIKNTVKEIQGEIKSTEKDISNSNRDVEKIKNEIVKETKRNEALSGGSKDKLNERLDQIKKQIEIKEQERDGLRSKIEEMDSSPDAEVLKLEKEVRASKDSINALQEKKRKISISQRDRYSPWGANLSRVLSRIQAVKEWHNTPIGPIGSLVGVKEEYSKWRDLVNASMGKTLDSFLVCDEHDRKILSKILKDARVEKNIITRKFEKFNYEEGTARGHTTFLDILTIEDENVLYTLVDSNSIEKNLITEDRRQLNKLASQRNVLNVFSLLNNRSGQRSSGDNKSFRIDPVYYRMNEPHKLSNGTEGSAKELARTDEQIEAEIEKVNRVQRDIQARKMSLKNDRKEIDNKYRSLQDFIRKLYEEAYRLENNLNEDGAMSKIEALKQELSENESQINKKEGILESLHDDIENEHRKYVEVRGKVSELKSKLQGKVKEQESNQKELSEFDVETTVLVTEMQHYEVKKDKRLDNVNILRDKISAGEERLVPLTADAESKCDRSQVEIRDEDTNESISAEYESAQEAVKEAEKSMGRSFLEIQKELLENKELKETCEQSVIDLDRIYQSLAHDLNVRFNYMHTTILRKIGEASSSFERSLALRGFKGELKFDFKDKLLTMLVQTKSDFKKRTIESLSGGEKSFSQVALLLAIWRVMDSKIRGLDEFDVFMDSVNRTISVRLLLSELRQYPKSQSIFITPQDVALIDNLDSDDVKIHKMGDPRRD